MTNPDDINVLEASYYSLLKKNDTLTTDYQRYRGQYEKLREGLQAIIDKANRDRCKVKPFLLEDLLLDNE